MAKRGGFTGGVPGSMNNLVKQAQRMQKQMEEKTKEMEEKIWEASVGGGAVTVKVSGKKEVLEVKLTPEVVDPDDIGRRICGDDEFHRRGIWQSWRIILKKLQAVAKKRAVSAATIFFRNRIQGESVWITTVVR